MNYRNCVKTRGDDGREHVEGECSMPNIGWVKFSGWPPLMKIRYAIEHGPTNVQNNIIAFSDGYGEPGYMPGGFDWSGIRDSTVHAIKCMERVADKWWGSKPWPWEVPEAQKRKED